MLVITKHSEAPWRKPEWSEIRIDAPNESINDYLVAALNDYALPHSKYFRKETEENQ